LIGLGNLPLLTPAHQVDFETGIDPGAKIDFRRTKPVWEKEETLDTIASMIVESQWRQ
jgi:hypothetical protein